jgi:EAL domain-containing protein (putative c-di-GMP-specific phosphodiesterase class I)/GGDEF domain-containing protein
MEIHNNNLFDPLTGLYNLSGFLKEIQQDNIFPESSHMMLYFNIVGFSTLNNSYGYIAGNKFLNSFAEKMIEKFPNAVASREFSDHFILMTTFTSRDDVIEKISSLQKDVDILSQNLNLILKVGICYEEIPLHDDIYLMDRAKNACSYVKKEKDKSYAFYSEQVEHNLERETYLLRNLDAAISKDKIFPFYQREMRALTMECCGYEALARWADEDYGTIPPNVFIPILEEARLINKLDIHIIEDVCRDLRIMLDKGLSPVPVSVNLSRMDFELCDIVMEIENIRNKYDISPDYIRIEITESAFTEDSDFLINELFRLKYAGYEIWMDDFGSGYSSLNNLKSYPFDVVKIDMNFMKEFETNPKGRIVLKSVIGMIKELKMHTLCEGVETLEQYSFLKESGCEKIQGFLFGKPMPVEINDDGIRFIGEIKGAGPKLEDKALSEYYQKIGAINVIGGTLLSSQMAFDMDNNGDIALSIIEVDGNNINYLYANKAYETFLKSIEISDVKTANQRANLDNVYENFHYIQMAEKAEKSANGVIEADFVINGYSIKSMIKFVARCGSKAAYVTVSRNLSNMPEYTQAIYLENAIPHILTLFFRIDLFDENGTVQNIYINSEQTRITDETTDSKQAVIVFAKKYIREDERKRFEEFYDMDTILDRIGDDGAGYISMQFHSPEDKIEIYIIKPIRYNDSWKFLSCCSFQDEDALIK